MNAILDKAMQHVKAGMHIFPVQPGEKTPIVKPGGRRMKWGDEATNDEGTVYDWWTHRCPTANIGVACKPSGLLVVDCDMPKEGKAIPPRFAGPGISCGEDIFMSITEQLSVPFPFETLTVQTPSGGAHYYFRNVDNVQLRQTSPVPGWIDVRGNGGLFGGYVLGPGSQLPNGDYKVSNRAVIQPAPPWLIALCVEPPEVPRPARITPFAGGEGKLDGLINSVANAQEGNRNSALHWAASKYCEEGHSISDALRDLEPAALDCGLDRSEIEPTIRSAFRGVGR